MTQQNAIYSGQCHKLSKFGESLLLVHGSCIVPFAVASRNISVFSIGKEHNHQKIIFSTRNVLSQFHAMHIEPTCCSITPHLGTCIQSKYMYVGASIVTTDGHTEQLYHSPHGCTPRPNQRDSDGFFSRRLVHRSSNRFCNLTDSSLFIVNHQLCFMP